MKHIIISIFVLCVGLTDNVYRGHIYQMITTNPPHVFNQEASDYETILIRKAIAYRRIGVDEDTSMRCFIVDYYRDKNGLQNVPLALIRHSISHWIDEIYPGERFEP